MSSLSFNSNFSSSSNSSMNYEAKDNEPTSKSETRGASPDSRFANLLPGGSLGDSLSLSPNPPEEDPEEMYYGPLTVERVAELRENLSEIEERIDKLFESVQEEVVKMRDESRDEVFRMLRIDLNELLQLNFDKNHTNSALNG